MFKIDKKIPRSLGRAGVLATPHGEIQTPAFVAVGTKATIKSLTPEQVKETGSQVVLANTYHLYLEPGEKVVKKASGLHNFMNWQGPIMTDSGGFQAFSLGVAYGQNISKFIGVNAPERGDLLEAFGDKKEKAAKITEDGVEFKSVIDGSKHFFTPEKSIQIQNDIGADIIFAFDECTSPHASKEYLKEAMERTHRWANRCLINHKDKKQALFGIVQGGRYEDLKKESAKEISRLGFEGFGLGGSFVKEDMATAVRWANEILPEEKPRHLLGVGEPIDLILGVENGCDTFDCVAPTRMARNGALYTKNGKINITNAKYKNLFEPVESGCECYTCKNYTAAYVSHLFRAKEMLAATLASIHNLYFLNNLMSQIRQSILDGTFFDFKEEFLKNYEL
jgi:queuine tRNA-ribosyltransferase